MAARELKKLPTWRLRGVPILTYHGISGEEEPAKSDQRYRVRDSDFRKQLEYIRRGGYSVWQILELCPPQAGARRAGGAVVLSFDDGLVSHYERAMPILAEFGMSACFFVSTAAVGRNGFLTWPQIAEMQRVGMAIHSHSHEHVCLSRLSQAAMERQMRDSRRILEDRLGRAVRLLSLPFGDTSRRVVQTALSLGYDAVCNSHDWPAQPGSSVLSRVAVHNSTSQNDYARLISGDARIYLTRALREKALSAPKYVLRRFRPTPASSGHLTSVEEK